MIVRRGTPADAPALAELRDIRPDRQAAFRAWMAAHSTTHLPFAAELDGRIVGSAWLHVGERIPGGDDFERRYGDIQSVMVREEHRNKGVGARLIAAILEEAKARNLQHITVHSGRRAVDFYLRNGFDHHRQLLLRKSESA